MSGRGGGRRGAAQALPAREVPLPPWHALRTQATLRLASPHRAAPLPARRLPGDGGMPTQLGEGEPIKFEEPAYELR